MSILSVLSGDFITEFLDDYYAECDEHLVAARQEILYLTQLGDGQIASLAVINELFRHFHSIKGLSGMVEVVKAEQIAHHIESYLRLMRDEAAPISVQALDLLMDSTTVLEAVIGAHRSDEDQPEIETHLTRLATLIPTSTPAPTRQPVISEEAKEASSKVPASTLHTDVPSEPTTGLAPSVHFLPASGVSPISAQEYASINAEGGQVWQLIFQPSPALDVDGINVTSVRQQLQAVGKLIHAAPWIDPAGGIGFVFVLITDGPIQQPPMWEARGIIFHPFPDPSSAKTRESAPDHPGKGSVDEIAKTKPSIYPNGSPIPESTLPEPADPMPRFSGSLMPSNVVRVDLTRLDELMRVVGDLVISRARLDDTLERMEVSAPTEDWRTFQEINQSMERQLRTLREGVMRVRMVPIGEVFTRMQFAALDVARNDKKQVALTVSGQETELDKFVVERMMDPLLHLVRNAVSHGLEMAEDRIAQGKKAVAVYIWMPTPPGMWW